MNAMVERGLSYGKENEHWKKDMALKSLELQKKAIRIMLKAKHTLA